MDENSPYPSLTQTPYENAGMLSRLLLCWLEPLLRTGSSRDLSVKDLHRLPKEDEAQELGGLIETLWKSEVGQNGLPKLYRCLIKLFGSSYLSCGLLMVIVDLILRLATPVVLSLFIGSFSHDNTSEGYIMYIYGALLSSLLVSTCLIYHVERLKSSHCGLKTRIALYSLIYRKILKLSPKSFETAGPGQVTSLLTNDIGKLEILPTFLNYLWIAVVQTVLGIGIMWLYIGPYSCIGATLLLLLMPIQAIIAHKFSTFRLQSLPKTDIRIQQTNEILSGMSTIKANGWEDIFLRRAKQSRREEVRIISSAFCYRAINMAMYSFTTKLITFCTLYPYYLANTSLTPEQVFTVISTLGALRFSLTLLWPLAVATLLESHISLNRLQSFLCLEETQGFGDLSDDKQSLQVVNVNASWTSDVPFSLKNITLSMVPGQVTGVVGGVGSGKSSLLQAIAGEMHIDSGKIYLGGRVNYLPPSPWIFQGTIKDNILFGQEYKTGQYEQVLKITNLQEDLKKLKSHDSTFLSQSGGSLSGGQKSRIHLARCLYRNAEVYLLDDPFASLDAKVGNEVFTNCIEFLIRKQKTVLLVTKRSTFLTLLDNIIVLERGEIIAQGSFHELSSHGLCIQKFLTLPNHEQQGDSFQREIDNATVTRKSSNAAMHHNQTARRKRISAKTYWSYIKSGCSPKLLTLVIFLSIGTQILSTSVDIWIVQWTKVIGSASSGLKSWITPLDASTIYIVLIFSTVLISLPKSIIFFQTCIKSAEKLHNNLIGRVLHSPLSHFGSNQIGSILQCCSRDMAVIDDFLPRTLDDVVTIFLALIGTSLTVALVSYWSLLISSIVAILFYVLRKFFLKTGRALKRLESKVRGPLLNYIRTTIDGIAVIRSNEMEEKCCWEFDQNTNLLASASFLFMCTTRWLSLVVDSLMNVYFSVVILIFIFINEREPSNVGLALSCILSLGISFQWAARQSAELENKMVSVERILECGATKSSSHLSEETKQQWPQYGDIALDNVSVYYNESLILKSVSIHINPGEKIAIVGRTGTGKSSLISALVNQINFTGKIYIDGCDNRTLCPEQFRTRISFAPQDSTLFEGSLRFNIDPFSEYSDEAILTALEQVEYPVSMSDNILSLNIKHEGQNISSGLKQLVCLARIFLRKSKLIILDEATSKLDAEAEKKIFRNLITLFKDSTICIVSHRLDNLLAMNKILVINHGNVVEFDSPSSLLKRPESKFCQLFHASKSLNWSKITHDVSASDKNGLL